MLGSRKYTLEYLLEIKQMGVKEIYMKGIWELFAIFL